MKFLKKHTLLAGMLVAGVSGVVLANPTLFSSQVIGATSNNNGAWTITNQSNALVTTCTIDLSPIGLVFNTTDDVGVGTDFESADTATTMLTAPEADGLDDADVPDGASSFTMTFNEFDPGETFTFGIDVDITVAGDEAISGNEIAGATIQCMVGGQTVSGTYIESGNSSSAVFAATEVPTLNLWGLFGLAGLIGFVAARRRRR